MEGGEGLTSQRALRRSFWRSGWGESKLSDVFPVPQKTHETGSHRRKFRLFSDLPQQFPQIKRYSFPVILNDYRSGVGTHPLMYHSGNCVNCPSNISLVNQRESGRGDFQADSAGDMVADVCMRRQTNDDIDDIFHP